MGNGSGVVPEFHLIPYFKSGGMRKISPPLNLKPDFTGTVEPTREPQGRWEVKIDNLKVRMNATGVSRHYNR